MSKAVWLEISQRLPASYMPSYSHAQQNGSTTSQRRECGRRLFEWSPIIRATAEKWKWAEGARTRVATERPRFIISLVLGAHILSARNTAVCIVNSIIPFPRFDSRVQSRTLKMTPVVLRIDYSHRQSPLASRNLKKKKEENRSWEKKNFITFWRLLILLFFFFFPYNTSFHMDVIKMIIYITIYTYVYTYTFHLLQFLFFFYSSSSSIFFNVFIFLIQPSDMARHISLFFIAAPS